MSIVLTLLLDFENVFAVETTTDVVYVVSRKLEGVAGKDFTFIT